jgi:hypothetical protein
MTACDTLLDTDIPGRVEEGSLNDPGLAQTLVNSALGQFECAYANYIATAGVLAGEYIVSSFFVDANIWGWRGIETRQADGGCPGRNASGLGAYTPLQQARFLADDAAQRIEGFSDTEVPTKNLMLAQLNAYSGYAHLLLAEGFCELAIDRSPLMTRAQVFALAEQKFTSAITFAEAVTTAQRDSLRNLALLGRARPRLNLGRGSDAAADAALIPANFVYRAEYSEVQQRRENRIFNLTRRNSFLSVAPAYRNLTIGTTPDSRVPVQNLGRAGHDGVTPQWNQNKFTLGTSPIPMASWEEAQLIIAEANAGTQTARDAINRLRTKFNLPQVGATETVDLAFILEERRRQLFSEGHRFNDMLRHNLPFPAGTTHKGQPYGPTTCMPLPDQERLNNPNIN